LFGISRAVHEIGLTRFKSNVTKTIKSFEYISAKLQGEAPSKPLAETAKKTKEKAKEMTLIATEGKGLCQQGHHQAAAEAAS
jgi:hypothetical protein